MTRSLMLLTSLALSLTACDKGAEDSATDSEPVECNTENEDCAPGTCHGEGELMLPGARCLNCHSEGLMPEDDEPDKWFGYAGTVYLEEEGINPAEGAEITVTDSEGKEVTVTSNAAGNFFTREQVTFPISAKVSYEGSTLEMGTHPSQANCNSCHSCDGGARGKLYVP